LIERTRPRTTRPLRSAPITGASALLQAGPPAHPATVLSPLRHQHRLERSLSPARTSRPGSIGTRLLLFHTEAADRARVVYMPDTAWPVSGHPPGSSRDSQNIPVSMSAEWVSTRQQRFACARLPGPHLTPLTTPFPHRSPRRSSANAAWGGLKPPSAGRLRRAKILHLPRSTASRTRPTSAPPCVQDTLRHPTGPGLLDGWPGSGLLLADDGGDVVGGHAVQVQVDVRRPFDRGLRRWERLSGPRHFWGERGHGAGRAQPCAAPPPREQAHRAGGTYGHDNRGGDQEHVDQLGHGGGPAGHLAEYCRAPGCRSVWYRPRHDP